MVLWDKRIVNASPSPSNPTFKKFTPSEAGIKPLLKTRQRTPPLQLDAGLGVLAIILFRFTREYLLGERGEGGNGGWSSRCYREEKFAYWVDYL